MVAALIDYTHYNFMIANCAPPCPVAQFPTPMFYLSFILIFGLAAILGVLISLYPGAARSEVEAEGEKLRLSDLEAKALRILEENGGEAPQTTIAANLGLGKVRSWRLVRRLERKGLVEITKTRGKNIVRIKEARRG